MAKFLHRRNGTYYFHKKIYDPTKQKTLFIRKTLNTKCYNSAKTLASLINYKICRYLELGKIMTKEEIEEITFQYLSRAIEEYDDLEDLRHQTNTISIRGNTYEGSTEKAIISKLNDFKAIDEKRDFDEVKRIVDEEIIPRCGIEPSLLKELQKKKMFYWKMFKYEIELLASDLTRYNEYSAKTVLIQQEQLYPSNTPVIIEEPNTLEIREDNNFDDVEKENKEVPEFDILISKISQYLSERRGISDKSIKSYIGSYIVINETFPHKRIDEITLQDLEYLEDIVIHLPKNRKKGKLTRELPILEQVDFVKKVLKERDNDIYDEKYKDLETLSADTINNYFDRIKFFISFCSEKYQFKNPFNKLVMESFRVNKDASLDKFPLSDDDIKIVFNEFDYLNKKLFFTLKNNPLKVYGIFFTLFLGMRPSEIGQLMVTDLKTTTNKDDETIYYLEVSKEDTSKKKTLATQKKTKTRYSKRKLPLTKIFLEDLKFLEFVEHRKANKHEFIFIDKEIEEKKLKEAIKNNVRRCEDTFNSRIKKFSNEIEDLDKKSYYSLRHSFANKIKMVPETLRDKRGESLMGHTRNNSELFNRYGNKYFEPDFLYEILETVEYGELNLEKFTEQIERLF